MVQKIKPKFTHPARPQYKAAVRVAKILRKRGFESYIVGGAVRDLLLGLNPKDFDLVTNALPDEIKQISSLKIVNRTDSAEEFGILRVKVSSRRGLRRHQVELEIASYRKDIDPHLGRRQTKVAFSTLDEDIRRRDFTINALAYDPLTKKIEDHVKGLEDLNSRIIRFIGQPRKRIDEDPLRILRGIRLKNQLKFVYESETAKAIRVGISDNVLANSSIERVRDELTHMFTHPSRREALADLDEFGLLKKLLPEIDDMHGVAQPPSLHAEGTVWNHTLLALHFLKSRPSRRLAWATLLHDVGKPPTAEPAKPGGRIRFNNHSNVGADIAKTILERFNFPSREIGDITWMIRYHLGIDDLPMMTQGHRDTILGHPAFSDLLELHRADAHASWTPNSKGEINTGPAEFKQLEDLYADYKKRTNKAPPPTLKSRFGVDGNWLKEEYGISDGRQIGNILQILDNEFKSGQINSRRDAKEIVDSELKES